MHADARCTIFLVPFRPSLCVSSDLIPVTSRLTISLIASLCISTSLPCTTRKTLISNVVRQLAHCTKRWAIVYQGDRSRCLSRTGVGIEKLRSPWRCASNVHSSSFSAYMHIALPSFVRYIANDAVSSGEAKDGLPGLGTQRRFSALTSSLNRIARYCYWDQEVPENLPFSRYAIDRA